MKILKKEYNIRLIMIFELMGNRFCNFEIFSQRRNLISLALFIFSLITRVECIDRESMAVQARLDLNLEAEECKEMQLSVTFARSTLHSQRLHLVIALPSIFPPHSFLLMACATFYSPLSFLSILEATYFKHVSFSASSSSIHVQPG